VGYLTCASWKWLVTNSCSVLFRVSDKPSLPHSRSEESLGLSEAANSVLWFSGKRCFAFSLRNQPMSRFQDILLHICNRLSLHRRVAALEPENRLLPSHQRLRLSPKALPKQLTQRGRKQPRSNPRKQSPTTFPPRSTSCSAEKLNFWRLAECVCRSWMRRKNVCHCLVQSQVFVWFDPLEVASLFAEVAVLRR